MSTSTGILHYRAWLNSLIFWSARIELIEDIGHTFLVSTATGMHCSTMSFEVRARRVSALAATGVRHLTVRSGVRAGSASALV